MLSTIKVQLIKDIHPDGNSFPINFTIVIWTQDSGGDSFIIWTVHYHHIYIRRICMCPLSTPFAGSHTAVAISEIFCTLGKSLYPESIYCCT